MTVARAIVVPLALWLLIGGFVTPDPAAVLLLTVLLVTALSAVGPLRRVWVGWIRTGRLRRTRAGSGLPTEAGTI
ncbi:hypothetical protein [Cryptosporangium aurantiacum]|nr:hypothetical protein [Cryptosporangium aurantiacum]